MVLVVLALMGFGGVGGVGPLPWSYIMVLSPGFFHLRCKIEALIQAMHLIHSKKQFPCLPFVAWAWIARCGFQQHSEDASGQSLSMAEAVWVVPTCSLEQFWSVPEDFIIAAFKFLEALPETKVAVLSLQSMQSAPSTQSLQSYMAPDMYGQNMQLLKSWLSSGRCPLYAKLDTWDEMDLVTPCWKDHSFFSQPIFQLDSERCSAVLFFKNTTQASEHRTARTRHPMADQSTEQLGQDSPWLI